MGGERAWEDVTSGGLLVRVTRSWSDVANAQDVRDVDGTTNLITDAHLNQGMWKNVDEWRKSLKSTSFRGEDQWVAEEQCVRHAHEISPTRKHMDENTSAWRKWTANLVRWNRERPRTQTTWNTQRACSAHKTEEQQDSQSQEVRTRENHHVPSYTPSKMWSVSRPSHDDVLLGDRSARLSSVYQYSNSRHAPRAQH